MGINLNIVFLLLPSNLIRSYLLKYMKWYHRFTYTTI